MSSYRLIVFALAGAAVSAATSETRQPERRWLAADPHVHSRWSLDYDESKSPPTAIYTDAIYPTPRNARMANEFGLKWMVTADHGGPNHATLNPASSSLP